MELYEPGPLYQVYRRRLTQLLDLVYKHSAPPEDPAKPETEEAALYPDELGWLLNELGLICSVQGSIPNAWMYFRMGWRLNAGGERVGYRSIVSKVNAASVLIELARLRQARDLLRQAITLVERLKAESIEIRARTEGYLGLVAHLFGDSQRALALYDETILHLHHLDSWRGVSVFSRHKCDLLRGEQRLDDAEKALRKAVAAAEAGFHPDLVHYCRISGANLRRVQGKPSAEAKASMLTPTLQFAEAIGSAKIESDVFRIRGLIELENGDLDAATRSTMRCLAISRANGLRLRTISSMELLGRLFAGRGYTEQAKSIYRTVVQMGQAYEYQRPAKLAQSALAKLEGR